MTPEFFGCLEVDTCCRCLRAPARMMTGHVTLGDELVFAGWCTECSDEMMRSSSARWRYMAAAAPVTPATNKDADDNFQGWCGHWVPEMGIRVYGSPSIAAARAALDGGNLLTRYMAPEQRTDSPTNGSDRG